MQIEIDKSAGFCFGVKNAVGQAEAMLEEDEKLYSLGHIVHNPAEVKRLSDIGLEVIDNEHFNKLRNCKVLIRAHGEPPETYDKALLRNITLIDATCPIVKHLQKKILARHLESQETNSQVVIYGKKNHPEVIGLAGQTAGEAIVISSEEDIELLDPLKNVHLYAQTTIDVAGFEKTTMLISEYLEKNNNDSGSQLVIHNTICRQVTGRITHLQEFAVRHQLMIFVGGKNSSNGKYLFDICKQANSNAHYIGQPDEIDRKWLAGIKSVGISGATSTPLEQLEHVRNWIRKEMEQ
jgi:4-hydroxy-3-methylbut-2-en-1-yl diphosphate reductase